MVETDLEVVIPAERTALTTPQRVRQRISALQGRADDYLAMVIDTCSEQICDYLNIAQDQSAGATLGRETVRETFYGVRGREKLNLSRTPAVSVVSVEEDGALIESQVGEPPADNPAFQFFLRNHAGVLVKGTRSLRQQFYADTVSVVYEAGFVLPYPEELQQGDPSVTLPGAIEDACALYVQHKSDQLTDGDDFSGPLKQVAVEGMGQFQFEGNQYSGPDRAIPFHVRTLLDRYRRFVV